MWVVSQLGVWVEEVLVCDNQYVDKGQLLVCLEDVDFKFVVECVQVVLVICEVELVQVCSKLVQQGSLIVVSVVDVNVSQVIFGCVQIDLNCVEVLCKFGYVFEEWVIIFIVDNYVVCL